MGSRLLLLLSLSACGTYAPRPTAETVAPQAVERRSLPSESPAKATASACAEQVPLVARFAFTGKPSTTLQFTRHSDRLTYRDLQRRSEWEFRVHPMRRDLLAASTIDHARRELVHWAHTDLIDHGLPTNWQLLTGFGVDDAMLGRFEATRETSLAYGLSFTRFVASPRTQTEDPTEIWWNVALRLPLKIVRADGTQHLEFYADKPSTRSPLRTRYARYRPVQAQIWFERHRSCCSL